MDTQPKIPTLKDSQKPQVKVRGLESGVTLFDRLKQFKKKDLAFILAGLGTLFMAPLAEHFMMSPEAGDGTLQVGSHGGKGFFDGSGSNPYEVGSNNGLAPGGPAGAGSDIITPLNVRDPSALVMGPGATQQPPTNSVMPSTPPPTAPNAHSDSDLKDALAASAVRGINAAARKALLPVPKIALAGSGGLRGLGVANGGSGASAGPISSAGLVSGKAANGGNMAGVRGGNNIKSVTRGQAGGDGNGTMDALKKAADAAAGAFNRNGASQALEDAARAGIPTGNGGALGGAGGGSGSTDKANGGDSSKDGKSVGESLAFLKAKAIQEAQIDLWKKEQEASDNKLEMYKMRNSMADALAGKIGGAIGDYITCPLTSGKSVKTCFSTGGASFYSCANPDPVKATPILVSVGDVTTNASCAVASGKDGSGVQKAYRLDGDTLVHCDPTGTTYYHCRTDAGDLSGKAATPGPQGSVTGFDNVYTDGIVSNLADVCTKSEINFKDADGGVKDFYIKLETAAQKLIYARDAMYNGASEDSAKCVHAVGASPIDLPQAPGSAGGSKYSHALDATKIARRLTAGNSADDSGTPNAVGMLKALANQTKDDQYNAADKAAVQQLKDAEKARDDAFKILTDNNMIADVNVKAPGLPDKWKDDANAQTKAAPYIKQITDAAGNLDKYRQSFQHVVDPNGGPLILQQKELDKIAGPAQGQDHPYLDQVVDTNSAYKNAAEAFKQVPGAPAITPATPSQGTGGDEGSTKSAILKAQGSVGDGKTGASASTPPAAPPAVPGAPAAPAGASDATTAVNAAVAAPTDKTKSDAAAKALSSANGDLTQMQQTQTAWLTSIGKDTQAIVLPEAPKQ